MKVLLCVVAVLAGVSAQNASSSTGGGGGSSTGMAHSSSTGGAASSSTGGSATTTTAAPVTCDAQTSCHSCFEAGCTWCLTAPTGGNSTSCMEPADVADNCPQITQDLPFPLIKIDFTKYGHEVCELTTCAEELDADAKVMGDLGLEFALANLAAIGPYLGCKQDPTQLHCTFDAKSLKGVDKYRSNCTHDLPKGKGSVCQYFSNETITYAGPPVNGTNGTDVLKNANMDVPFCLPESCSSKSFFAKVFKDAEDAYVADPLTCESFTPGAKSCENTNGGKADRCSVTPGGDDSGLSTGAVIGIVLGGLVGVGLLIYCGQQMCRSQKSEYEAF